MSNELQRLLTEMAERGEWHGAETLLARAASDLDGTSRRLVGEGTERPRWALALGAAVAALALIGGAVLMFRGDEHDLAASTPTTSATPDTTVASSTTIPPTTTTPFVQQPMTWTRIPIDGDHIVAVVAGGPGLIAAGEADGNPAFWTSADGADWERVSDDEASLGGDGSYQVIDLAVIEGRYVAIGHGNRQIVAWTSSDGLTWDRIPVDVDLGEPGQKVSISAMTAGRSGLVVVGWVGRISSSSHCLFQFDINNCEPDRIAGHFVIRSTDGTVWERSDTSGLPLGGIKDVVAGGPGYVAVGVDWSPPPTGRAAVWTSPDGLTWALIDPARVAPIPGYPGTYEMESLTTTGDGSLVGFGSGSVWMSTDGATWTWVGSFVGEREDGFSQWWSGWPTAPVSTGDRIVVAGALELGGGDTADRAAVWASDDAGATWVRMSQPLDVFGGTGTGGMVDITEIDGTYVAVGTWNSVATVWLGTWNEDEGA